MDMSNEARNGQDLSKVDDDIVKDFTTPVRVLKHKRNIIIITTGTTLKDCHEDSKEYCDK